MTGSSKFSKLAATIAALLAAVGGITIAVTAGPDDPGGPPRTSVTITLGGQGRERITLSPQAQQVVQTQVQRSDAGSPVVEDDLHEQVKPAPAEIAQGNAAAPAGSPVIPDRVPQAAQSVTGCRSQFVRNQSSRNGAKVAIGMIHWTGSRSLAGWADVDAITRWFDTSAAQASSNFITDDEGHCAYVVPMTAKAWTQAAANPWAVSVEYINPGVLPVFTTKAGKARVVALMRLWHEDFGIPYRLGAVNSACVPTRSGFLAHRDLGACGGGHPDIGVPSAVPELIAAAKTSAVIASERDACAKIAAYRKRKTHNAGGTAAYEARVKLVHGRGHYCSRGRVHE